MSRSQEGGIGKGTGLGKYATEALGTGVLQPTALAVNRHAHFGRSRVYAQFGKEPAEQWIRALVVHDEAGVDGNDPGVRGDDIMRVGVAAETARRLIEGDVIALLQDIRRREARDARPHHRCPLPPCSTTPGTPS